MNYKKLLATLLPGVLTVQVTAQDNFTFSPARPHNGDSITITYIPSGDIKGIAGLPDAAVYQVGNDLAASDLALNRSGGKLTATFRADTAANFIYLVFSDKERTDNNFDNGYCLNLYEGQQVKRGSFANQALFYSGNGGNAGITRDPAKAVACYKREFALYPESKPQFIVNYLRSLIALQGEEANVELHAEIQAITAGGLQDEEAYSNLEALYKLARLQDKADSIALAARKRFPKGKWFQYKTLNDFYEEADPSRKAAALSTIIARINTDTAWGYLQERIPSLKQEVASAYMAKNDWSGFRQALNTLGINDRMVLAELYNDAAWKMQESGQELNYATEIAAQAVAYAKVEMESPTVKPERYTRKQWKNRCRYSYGMYADTYGMILFKTKQYQKGLPYAREAALVIAEGKNADLNNTYVLLAEKALPRKTYQKELEQMVTEGKSTTVIKDILKRAYAKDKGSEAGFAAYLDALEEKGRRNTREELRQTMLQEQAPPFSLTDLEGKQVSLASLRGKVVVLDFWATWCGPCKASFSGMQHVADKYKHNPDVVFLFIDTWESAPDKEKNAAAFITKHQYPFRVLMDNDNKVVSQFKVDGIPTKFVLDKQGKICFKSTGFDNEESLARELSAMIDLAGE